MKHINLFFYVTLLTLWGQIAYGQTNVDIGTSSNLRTDNSPIQRNTDYSASELLYLSSEINNSGLITGLGFNKYSGSGTVTIDSVYIYLKTTADTTVDTTTSTAGYTLVYQGPFPNTSTGWKTVDFNMVSDFHYLTSAGNLSILIIRPYQASNTSRPYYRYTEYAGTARNAWFRNSYAWSDTVAMNISPWRPNIRLMISPTCPAATTPTATNITPTTADLNWNYTGSPMTFEIKYGLQGFNVNTAGTSIYTTTKPYTLNPPLTPSTSYSYYVRAICTAGDTSVWTAVTNFATPATCVAPTAPTSTGITKNSAILNWTNAGSPINYEIKYGTQGFNVNTAGTSVFTTTKPYTLNPPLTPATNYSYYVRYVCTPGDTSAWSPVNNFATLCDYPEVLSTAGGNVCGTGTTTLNATASGSGNIKWYENATSGIELGSGNNFITPVISSTTNFYAEAFNVSNTANVGRNNATTPPVPTTSPNNSGQGIAFTALKDITIDSIGIWVGTSTAQPFTVQLLNNSNTALNTFNLTTPVNPSASGSAPVKTYFTLNVPVATGTGYRLIALANPNVLFGRENTGVNSTQFSTYTSDLLNITGGVIMPSTIGTTNYYFFYNIAASGACTNPTRQAVTATVTSSPLATLPDTAGTCNGAAATLNSGSANTTWTPIANLYTNAVATNAYTGGTQQTVYALETTPETVYATTTVGSCTFNDSVYVDVQTGTAVDVTPGNPSMVCGDATAISLASNTPVSWMAAGGSLYTDAAATTAYTPGSATASVFAKANNNIYVKGSYDIGGCTFADSAFITVNNAPATMLANAAGAANTDSTVINGAAAGLHNAECELMASVTPTGGAPVSGLLTGKVFLDASVQNTVTGPYVTRHFELTPKENAATSNATITLYFTQPEFDAYNGYVTTNGDPVVNPLLPSVPGGSTANILVDKFNAASGSPSPTNNNSAVAITPTSVTWDPANNWWAVTFPTTGFSGFFLHTNVTNTPLPIVWKNVSATLNRQKQAVINWSVAEKEADAYHILKSTDGNTFEKTATVNSKGNGNNAYTFTDAIKLSGKAWYRIIQVSKEGKEDYSKIMALQNSSIYGRISIYPNPAIHVLMVETEAAAAYSIYDLQGKAVSKGNLQSGKNTLNVSGLAKGFYTIKIGDYNQKIVLQ